MPNWKKVITSGSNAHLNHITASGTIHGNQIVGGSTVYDTAGNIVAYGANRSSIIIQTSNNNSDAGIAFRNSGGSYSNNIYRTNIGDSDADLRIAGGNTQGTITNLDDYVAIKGGEGTTAGFVGIGNNEPSKKLTVDGDISASGDILNTTTVQMTNSSSVIDTFNTGSNNSCKYLLQVTSGSHIQSSEMLVMQNGLNAFNTEYAQIGTDVNLGSFSTSVSDANVKLNFAGDFISCSVKFNRTLI
jgi:hypothetical protein